VSAVIFLLSLVMMLPPMVPSQWRQVPAQAMERGTTSGRTNFWTTSRKSFQVQFCFGAATPACWSSPVL
jgi:hypothetical protein